MSWERRGNRSYYYRKQRIEGRVVSIYVGCGLHGEMVAAEDSELRLRKRADRLKRRQQTKQLSVLESKIELACDLTDCVMHSLLYVAGYHQHRGQWRRRRE